MKENYVYLKTVLLKLGMYTYLHKIMYIKRLKLCIFKDCAVKILVNYISCKATCLKV